MKKLDKVTNHPVHMTDEEGKLSPTALIPFCEFGGNMSVMGVKIDQFDVPVCNSFRPKIMMDQLCYTVDPNEYKHKIDLNGEISLLLFIHYNEDRQMEDIDSTEEYTVIVDTIGKMRSKKSDIYYLITEPLELSLDMEISLNVIKEIRVTESFLTLNKDAKGCQEESFNECTTTKYKENIINQCQCLPFQLRLSEEVSKLIG